MFITKLLTVFITPIGFAMMVFPVTLILFYKKYNRLAMLLAIVAVTELGFFSTPIIARSIAQSLEQQYLAKEVSEYDSADVIVVLGGALGAPDFPRKYLDLSDGADRVLHAMQLYRAEKAKKIIVSGGKLEFLGYHSSEARLMKQLLMLWGVEESAIVLEEESRNSYENAIYTKKLMQNHGYKNILLVTSALHMPRALAVFQRQDVTSIPAPTDYLVTSSEANIFFRLLPSVDALMISTYSLKEYIGRFVYYLRDWI